jgi:hypothetical protein
MTIMALARYGYASDDAAIPASGASASGALSIPGRQDASDDNEDRWAKAEGLAHGPLSVPNSTIFLCTWCQKELLYRLQHVW